MPIGDPEEIAAAILLEGAGDEGIVYVAVILFAAVWGAGASRDSTPRSGKSPTMSANDSSMTAGRTPDRNGRRPGAEAAVCFDSAGEVVYTRVLKG